MMLLRYVTIENFKSFKGVHKIGPFRSHTSVKVPIVRGVGKTDFLTAVSFLLGQELSHSKAVKLVYNAKKSKTARNCSVAGQFAIRNDEMEAGVNKVELKRSILMDKLVYFVDEDSVSKDDYLSVLDGINVNVNSGKHLFLTQKHLNDMMEFDPEDLLVFMEMKSGSIRYKNEYDSLRKQILKLKVKLSKIEFLVNDDSLETSDSSRVNPDASKLRELKEKIAVFSKKFAKCKEVRCSLFRTVVEDILVGMNTIYSWMYEETGKVVISDKYHCDPVFPEEFRMELEFSFSKLDGEYHDFRELISFEKFLATLSLLFSVILAEKSGMLILDEVDGNFRDDAHPIVLKRFATLVKNISEICQVLVVSRNKDVCRDAKAMVEILINEEYATSFAEVHELQPIQNY